MQMVNLMSLKSTNKTTRPEKENTMKTRIINAIKGFWTRNIQSGYIGPARCFECDLGRQECKRCPARELR